MKDALEEETTCYLIRQLDADGQLLTLSEVDDWKEACKIYEKSDAPKTCLFRMTCSVTRLATK